MNVFDEINWNMNEMNKLAIGLAERGIEFKLRYLWHGMQILCDTWDAVCHDSSYGHENGLIEVMGTVCRSEDDDVEGWLTADEILSRL